MDNISMTQIIPLLERLQNFATKNAEGEHRHLNQIEAEGIIYRERTTEIPFEVILGIVACRTCDAMLGQRPSQGWAGHS
jgi:hypothetical protein